MLFLSFTLLVFQNLLCYTEWIITIGLFHPIVIEVFYALCFNQARSNIIEKLASRACSLSFPYFIIFGPPKTQRLDKRQISGGQSTHEQDFF